MKSPRLKLWSLCLAVAASAVAIKLAMMAGVLLTVTTTLLFLGPICGIVAGRHRGGTGVAGGVIAGIISGVVIAAILNLYAFRAGRPFAWFEWAASTTLFVILEAFCGWHWGRTARSWHWPTAKLPVADPKANGI